MIHIASFIIQMKSLFNMMSIKNRTDQLYFRDKAKRPSEQAAASVCLQVMDIHDGRTSISPEGTTPQPPSFIRHQTPGDTSKNLSPGDTTHQLPSGENIDKTSISTDDSINSNKLDKCDNQLENNIDISGHSQEKTEKAIPNTPNGDR